MADTKQLADALSRQIKAGDRLFEDWEKRFRCKELNNYYEGLQDQINDDSYVFNLFFSTFQIKQPTLTFRRPIFFCDPKPNRQDFDTEAALNYSQKASDVLNTYVTTNKMGFADEIELSLIDAGSYFGIVEVGFDANWVMNPNAGRPVVKKEFANNPSVKGIVEPEEIPIEEWIYAKRIPAHRFRVGNFNQSTSLEDADWCGYYDFYKREELESKAFNFRNLKPVSVYADAYTPDLAMDYTESDSESKVTGLIKAWKIWHNRTKKFYFLADSEDGAQIGLEDSFKFLPLYDLRFFKRRMGFYPIPLFYNWKSPQDEQNEIRNQMRTIRRRSRLRYAVKKGALEPDQLDKFTGPDDVAVVEVETDNAINPVMNPQMDASIQVGYNVSKDDFNIVSGTSSEARGEADKTTATQATITNQRAGIREAAEREKVALWLCRIATGMLNLIRDRMTLPFWIKTNQDAGAFGQDVDQLVNEWQLISSEDMGDIDYIVNVSVESLSPVANEQELNKFIKFLAILKDNPQLAIHPGLIGELAARLDYRNTKVIKFFQQMAQIQMIGMMAQMGGAMPQETNNAQKTVEQMTPPAQAQIENQLAAQGLPSDAA